MAISRDNIDFLFDIMNFYDNQYDKITDNCFDEVLRALNEICSNIHEQNVSVMPFGCYAIKNNYQAFEPMEFYCVLKSSRNILQKENLQKEAQKKGKKKKKSVKKIYQEILSTVKPEDQTSIDMAKLIAQKFQLYVDAEDKVMQKNNVIFVKFNYNDDTKISVVIHVVYDFDGDGIVEFAKLGFPTKQNPVEIIANIQQKNIRTNGNYLLLCKLIKMLELELILANRSNVVLSAKTFFVENILYNVPDRFFAGEEFSEIFSQIVNYLRVCPIENILIPDSTNTKMFDINSYYANSEYDSFVRKLSYICKNGDDMITDALSENNSNNMQNISNDLQNQQTENSIKKINKNK